MPAKRDIHPDDIVGVAIELLAKGGFANFSALKVAKRYGIRQSHLTYYFPTRDDLLAAMSETLITRYESLVEKWCSEALAVPGDPLPHIIDQMLIDAVEPPTSILFPALWEAANVDPNMAAAVDRIYDTAQKRLIQMLGVDPASPQAEPLWPIVRILGTAIEGCTAIYGRTPADSQEFVGHREALKALLLPAFAKALAAAKEG